MNNPLDITLNGIEVLGGGRASSTVYRDIETNYVYKKQSHKRDRDCIYFICAVQNCTGTAVYKNASLMLNRPHNHDPDARKINAYHVLNRCKERAATENTPVKQIFSEEMARFPTDTPLLNIKDVESTIIKHRKRDKHESQCTPADFIDYLNTSRYGKTVSNDKFYKDHQELPDGSVNVIFVSPGLAHLLLTTEILYMDASNHTVPGPPKFSQLLIIFAGDMGMIFPVVYVLMTHETVDAFTAVLKYIRDMAPSCNPGTIITGFSDIIQRAVQRIFGEHHGEILGDFHHFAQLLKRKLEHPSLDLMGSVKANDEPAATIVKSIFSIPLLPAQRCIEGIQVIRHQTEVLLKGRPELFHKTKKFLDYIEDYWFNMVGIPAVFEKWKDNEWHLQVNSFNTMFVRYIYSSVKTTNSVWNYVDKMIRCEDRERQKFARSVEGQRLYHQKAKCITKEPLAKTMMAKLEKNEIYVWQFLTELVEITFINDDFEHISSSEDGIEHPPQVVPPPPPSQQPTNSNNVWESSPIDNGDMYQSLNTSNPKRIRSEHIEIKPSLMFSSDASNSQKPSKRVSSVLKPNGSGVNSQEQCLALLQQHVQRQNEILASMLSQTNMLYESIAKFNSSQSQQLSINLQNDLTIHKSLIESIHSRTQQLQPSQPQHHTLPPTDHSSPALLCRLCQHRRLQVLFRPCGHICSCKPCWDNVKDHKPFCPMCQDRVLDSIDARI